MFNQEKSLEGNRKYRRKKAKQERSKLTVLKSRVQYQDYLASKLRERKLANRIAKVQTRKLERLAIAETNQAGSTDKKSKKMSPALQKQLKRRVKSLNFKTKVKKIIG